MVNCSSPPPFHHLLSSRITVRKETWPVRYKTKMNLFSNPKKCLHRFCDQNVIAIIELHIQTLSIYLSIYLSISFPKLLPLLCLLHETKHRSTSKWDKTDLILFCMDLISGSKVGKSYSNHTMKNLNLD